MCCACPLSAEKAPAGYGLGTTANTIKLASPDDATAFGLCCCDVESPLGTDTLFNYLTIPYNSYYATQIAFRTVLSQTQIAVRQKNGGTWQPWEWPDPPMELGVEYRTTERHRGKVVYAKTFDFGTLPNGTYRAVGWASSGYATAVLRVSGVASDGTTIPYTTNGGKRLDISGAPTWVVIYSESDNSAYTATVTVWFTKD